jgi:LysM repeat protein
MMRLRAMLFGAALFLLMSGLGGCIPGNDSRLDEEKDPHFQRGRNLVRGEDFKGAVQEFEMALETNPHSAAAHFELGCLYETRINDYAAAIYHYERHLTLQPNSEHAQLVKERIRGCKQQLANSEFPLPDTQNLQREVDRLTQENFLLKQQLDALRNPGAANPAAAVPRVEPVRVVAAAPVAAPVQPVVNNPPAASAHPRVHVVKERDTIYSIAAQYSVKASAVLAANPNIDPRRLRIGQSLNLP